MRDKRSSGPEPDGRPPEALCQDRNKATADPRTWCFLHTNSFTDQVLDLSDAADGRGRLRTNRLPSGGISSRLRGALSL